MTTEPTARAEPEQSQDPAPKSERPESRSLSDVIPRPLDDLLRAEGVDVENPQVSRAIQISLRMTRGNMPLPPPDLLQEYKDLDPDLLPRIVKWTETQATHRRGLEKQRADRGEARLDRAQYISAFVAVLGLIVAGVLGVLGATTVAIAIAIVAVAGPAGAIAISRWMSPSKS